MATMPAGLSTSSTTRAETPLKFGPITAIAPASTSSLAAATPLSALPSSSLGSNSIGEPLTPPASLTCSAASSAPLRALMPLAELDPLSGPM